MQDDKAGSDTTVDPHSHGPILVAIMWLAVIVGLAQLIYIWVTW